MASVIKPIEARSIHQIQSGQVIVDLCSVVKELVENALDASASTIEVRFKNNGLDSIEVQDNGTGISEANYENLALKHYTSKLSTYEDLTTVQTFGFRGEALSSLCALSDFSVITAQADEAPKGKRLDFETSGKLKSISLTAAQKGTTITVENLFAKLPVRQKELSKNIKREYGKVLGLLHAYACISTQVKFTVKNAMPKGRSSVVFSTKGNATTRDNIANVYGAKMLPQLIELNLKLDFQSSSNPTKQSDTEVTVCGHISKPVFGEGRQTPDRQMFFVNGRPCGLPQIAKAINEIYKSYNVSQSPFIFADFRMDTNAYDVNVSPDKRTILLHDAAVLTDSLKTALSERFDDTEQTVPQSQIHSAKLPSFRPLTVSRTSTEDSEDSEDIGNVPIVHSISGDRETAQLAEIADGLDVDEEEQQRQLYENSDSILKAHFGNIASTRDEHEQTKVQPDAAKLRKATERRAEKVKKLLEKTAGIEDGARCRNDTHSSDTDDEGSASVCQLPNIPVRDFNARMSEQQTKHNVPLGEPGVPLKTLDQHVRDEENGVMPSAFDRMRPRRASPELATITIGDKTTTRMIGSFRSQTSKSREFEPASNVPPTQFSQRLQKFGLGKAGAFSNMEQNIYHRSNQEILEGEDFADLRSLDGGEITTTESHSVSAQDDYSASISSRTAEQTDDPDSRAQEENRVAELIRLAEASNTASSREKQHRAVQALKGSTPKDSIVDQIMVLEADLDLWARQAAKIRHSTEISEEGQSSVLGDRGTGRNEEERLSLTISKSDFAKMHIAGQFNLGFIIAVRPKLQSDPAKGKDELFIIDQHASDEKYNFERLQAETIVGNQRLVHPIILDLTAVEEETILENESALQQNGFIIDADESGQLPVGQRCKLLSLPLSKEVTFNLKDLEELIHLLSDSHISAGSTYVPRPSKVRKMFAMRACRSSIMIGKTLSRRQMRNVLDHMGRIDKPWNCPHGRPTMRHLTSLDSMDLQLWKEGDGVLSAGGQGSRSRASNIDIWNAFTQ